MKTPIYTKRAIDNYRKKRYFMQVNFPAEYKQRLIDAGLNASEVQKIILEELQRREAEKTP